MERGGDLLFFSLTVLQGLRKDLGLLVRLPQDSNP